MKKSIGFFALCLAIVGLAWMNTGSIPLQGAQSDKEFIIKAAQSNIAEIAAGKLAIQKASSDSVKMFGQMMVDDHTLALHQLDSIVRAKGGTLPADTDERHKKQSQQLQGLSGSRFDAAYISSQLEDHKVAITLFERQASAGQDAALKSYAVKMLPHLRMHLTHAQMIASGIQQTASKK